MQQALQTRKQDLNRNIYPALFTVVNSYWTKVERPSILYKIDMLYHHIYI